MLQVLKAYTQFRPDEGYCQAQGPVAAVLLMNMPIEVHICSQKHGHITSFKTNVHIQVGDK